MLTVETIARVRREYGQGKSIREIARGLRMSRHTVRKYLRSGETEAVYERGSQPYPRLGPYREALEGLLEDNEKKPARDRLNGRKLFDALAARGYGGGYDAVRRYAKRWREQRRQQEGGIAKAFVPLAFDPGEAYQFDWAEEWIVLNGVTTKVQVAHFRLCHSRMPFLRVYPRQTLEMVMDAHAEAFRFYGGTCGRGIYDNMKTAVDLVLTGKDRVFNRRFAQMCSHYLVEPTACTPAAGWEKGGVENQIGTQRTRLFRPRPRVSSLAELNSWLAEECGKWAATARHPEQADRTIGEVFEAEQAALVPVTVPFDGFTETATSASRTCLVRYDRNQYSVDARAASSPVQVRAYATRIVILKDGEVVGDHERRMGRGQVAYDPLHYIPVLERKPGALRNGAPFKQWSMPTPLNKLRRRLGRSDDGDRQFVRILSAIPDHGLEAVVAACEAAITENTASPDVVLNLLHRRNAPPETAPATVPGGLTLSLPPRADCRRYDSLREKTGEARHGPA